MKTVQHNVTESVGGCSVVQDAAETEYVKVVNALQKETEAAQAALSEFEARLKDCMTTATLNDVLQLLHTKPDELANRPGIPPGQMNAACAAMRLKQLQQDRKALDEKHRLRRVLQAFESNSISKDLSAPRVDGLERVRIMRAQLRLSLEGYLEATPFILRSLSGWQKQALTLRDSAELDERAAAVAQCAAYKTQLDKAAENCAAISQAFINCFPCFASYMDKDKMQEAISASISDRRVLVQKAETFLSSSDTTGLDGSNAAFTSLHAPLTASFEGNHPAIKGVIPLSKSALALRALANGAAAVDAAESATLKTVLVDLPLVHLEHLKFAHDHCESEVLSMETTLWKEQPNDHWSPLHAKLVLSEWNAYEKDIGL